MAELAAEVRRLSDRAALADLADQYLRSLDEGTFDEARARSIFADDVTLSFPPGDHDGHVGVAEFTHGFMHHWDRTQHNVSHYLIELDGDRAAIGWNVFAVHIHHGSPPPPAHSENFYLGGRFDGTAVRTYLGWRLQRLVLRIVWSAGQGVPSIVAVMGERETSNQPATQIRLARKARSTKRQKIGSTWRFPPLNGNGR